MLCTLGPGIYVPRYILLCTLGPGTYVPRYILLCTLGPGTYVPRKEVEVVGEEKALIIKPNQALRLRALRYNYFFSQN